MTRGRDAGWSVAIFVAVAALYLVTSSREPAWGDARPMWEVATQLVAEHRIDIGVRWPEDIPPGRGGKIYGIAPIGPALMQVPGVVLAGVAHHRAPTLEGMLKPLCVHLGPALLGALACVVLFGLLRDLGIRVRTASACAAILACSTTTWVYARMPYSEILQLVAFLGLFRHVLRVSALAEPAVAPDDGLAHAPATVRREGLWFGLWAGVLLDAKYVFAGAIVGAVVAILWAFRLSLRTSAGRQVLLRLAGWAAVTGGPLLALALAYNYARWGSVTATGYEPYLASYFGGSLFDGLWGMLLSPTKSAFLYSPPLVLAMIGLPAAVRAVPRLGVALLAMVVPIVLVYSTYRSWSGDYAWGPRFFVWAVPVLLVPLAWFIDRSASRWRRAVLVAVVAGGIGVQVLGSALYWDHFIRIAITAKNQWLGQPDRSGSYIPEKGRGHCDSCFEDTYELLWTPPFSPIRGNYWLLKAMARGDDWKSAQVDAPWRGYTTLPIDLSQTYPRARIDWWVLLWALDLPATRTAGVSLLALMLAALAAGVWRWLRLHRASPAS